MLPRSFSRRILSTACSKCSVLGDYQMLILPAKAALPPPLNLFPSRYQFVSGATSGKEKMVKPEGEESTWRNHPVFQA